MPCSDLCPCPALRSLGYLVVHAREGEIFGLVAIPNAQTLTLKGGAWLATPGASSGFSAGEVRAIAVDRGGACL